MAAATCSAVMLFALALMLTLTPGYAAENEPTVLLTDPSLAQHNEDQAHTLMPPPTQRQHRRGRNHAQPQTHGVPTVLEQCSGSAYDFSTSAYCRAPFPTASSYQMPQNPPGVKNMALKSIQMITRHGDRAPVNILPYYDVAYDQCSVYASTGYYNIPQGSTWGARRHTKGSSDQEGRRLNQIPTLSPQSRTNPFAPVLWQGTCATGQLTDVGIEQHLELGAGLRQVYVDKLGLLPETYSRENASMYLRSTDIWRTKQSAEALLSGLWPTQSLANEDVIPVHTFPLEAETMFANAAACPTLAQIRTDQYQSKDWQKHLDVPTVWAEFDRVLGVGNKPDWHQGFDHYVDNFRTRQCHSLPLPCNPSNSSDCISQGLADFVFAQGDWEYAWTQTVSPLAPKLAQLGIGAFMAIIRDVMVATVVGDPSLSTIGAPTFAYYSGHDTTLSAVLGFLNVTGMAWPPYASNFIIELWQDTDVTPSPPAYYVRVLYNAQVLKLFQAGCCDALCPYQQIVDYMDSMIPDNIAELCNAGKY